jgi:HlyD family secretion protein
MNKLISVTLLSLLLMACKDENKLYNGYVDAELVYLSADFPGRLVDLSVLKGQMVKPNQFLFRLEQTSENHGVAISEYSTQDLQAQRDQAVAQLHYYELNYQRIKGMIKQNAASQNDLDLASRDFDVAKKQLQDLDIKIKSSLVSTEDKQWQVERKENNAPEMGIVFDTYYTKGEYVQAGYPIVSLVTPSQIKTIFFVPEPNLSQLRLNQKVNIMTSHNDHFAKGHVTYISQIAEYTPPILYSREDRHRLVFRVEAKIESPDLTKLHLGLPVTLELIP